MTWSMMSRQERRDAVEIGAQGGLTAAAIARQVKTSTMAIEDFAKRNEIVLSGTDAEGGNRPVVADPVPQNPGGGHVVPSELSPATPSIGNDNGTADGGNRASAWSPVTALEPIPENVIDVPASVRAGEGWNEVREHWLRHLWGKGLSCSQIAAQLGGGLSRNAVIGKVHRMSLALNRPTTGGERRVRKPKERKFSSYVRPKPRPGEGLPITRPRAPRMVPIEDLVVPISLALTLFELTEATCRFPDGAFDEPAKTFCGHKPFNGLPYCEYHSRIAYQPVNDRRSRWDDERREAARIAGLKRAAAREGVSWTAS